MARGTRLSHLPLALFVLAIAVQGCGASSPAAGAPDGANGCDKWCGSGSATITFGGATDTVSPGGCVDDGIAGIDARFGDWQGVSGVAGYLMLIVYRPGAPRPTAAPATVTFGFPNESPLAEPTVVGSVNGEPFVLGPDTVVSIAPNDTGSFSGTDVNGLGPASGTFHCR